MQHLELDSIIAASHSEDGQAIALQGSGPSGECWITLPVEAVSPTVATMMTAAQRALDASGSKIRRESHVRFLKIEDNPARENVTLLVGLHTGAPPLALSIPRKDFQQFALGVLQTAGIATTEHSGEPQ